MQCRVRIASDVVDDTLELLRAAGSSRHEGIVLWLGSDREGAVCVREAYVPVHTSGSDYFHIPPGGMDQLLNHLDSTGTFVAAQVHSHPFEAFHSQADDAWAIVRHCGALSLVVPYFAFGTDSKNFLARVAAFRLSAADEWERIEPSTLSRVLEIANAP